MSCQGCKRDKTIVARGLCNACYTRWHKTGTTEYQRKGKRTQCEIPGCIKFAVSHGLCDTHRRRMERHGHTEDTRPDSWGAKTKHPLYHSWQWLLRHKASSPICPEWENDFLQFVIDVGDRPSPTHKLFSADAAKPIGPDNFVWKRAVTERALGESQATYEARRQRVYRKLKQEETKGYALKRYFGLSWEQYEALLSSQGGKCAVCGNGETLIINGKELRLAVDHCHTTGKVRGLLCSKCNQLLGCAKESIEILERAIEYLKK
jgi:Recombination endonuclease VII